MSNYFDPTAKENMATLEFFETKIWLVVDPSSSTRSSIKKTLTQLGSKISNIFDTDNLNEARNIIAEKKPHFIIGNKTLSQGSTIELFGAHIKIMPNRAGAGFFVITEENSLSEAAIALDYDMDGLISIPFTGQSIINTILAGMKYKLAPSPYLKLLYLAQELLIKEDLDFAQANFEEALALNQHPYEAYYYLAEIYKQRSLFNEAISAYEKAFFHNPQHYKTLRDMSALYDQMKDFKKAYESNVQMAQSYPILPERIPELVRLSIINQKYADIINYLRVFDALKSPSVDIQNALAAGLAVLGKYFFSLGETDNAIDTLKRAFHYSNGKYEVLRSIARTFQEMNKSDIMLEAFERIDLAQWPDNAEVIYFNTLHLVSNDHQSVINYGEKLLKRKIMDTSIYRGIIERGIKMKRKLGIIEGQVFEAIRHFPAHKEEFEALLEEAQAALA